MMAITKSDKQCHKSLVVFPENQNPKKKMKAMEDSKSNSNNKWVEDLHQDIMRLITGKLLFVDQARVRAVCERWRQKSSKDIPAPAKQFPWLFECKVSTRTVTLSDPVYGRTYELKDAPYFDNLTAWDSKGGWLLLSGGMAECQYFLYNPFTLNHIQLPPLDTPSPSEGPSRREIYLRSATFSCPPTSSLNSCTVVIFRSSEGYETADTVTLEQKIVLGTIYIDTCSPGDKSWSRITLRSAWTIFVHFVYLDSVFYSLSRDVGKETMVGAFDTRENSWSLIPASEPRRCDFLVASAGELLVVCISDESNKTFLERPYVFKLLVEQSKISWITLETLGNRALFLSHWRQTPFSVEVSDISAKTGGIEADGIYCFLHFKPKLFSLKTGSMISTLFDAYKQKMRGHRTVLVEPSNY